MTYGPTSMLTRWIPTVPETSPMTAHPDYDPALPTREAAAYLGIHPKTLQGLARRREVTAIRSPGGRLSFRLSTLNRYLDGQTVEDRRPSRRVRDIDWGA